jgi:hypothetical protein
MAIIYRHDFTGTASTNGSAAIPTTGTAMSLSTGAEATLTGTGQLQGGASAYYDLNTAVFSDGTIKLRWTPPTIFTGDVLLFFRTQDATFVWNNDGTALTFQSGQPIALQDRATSNGIDATLATAGTAVGEVAVDVWIRLDGLRCRIWIGTNVGTPDIDVSTLSRSTGYFGLVLTGATAFVDFIEIDNVAMSPGESVFQTPNAFVLVQSSGQNVMTLDRNGLGNLIEWRNL